MSTFIFSKKGFTLLEVIVGMAITVVLFAIGFVGIISLRRSFELRNGYNDLAINLRSLQNEAKNVVSDESGNIPKIYSFRFSDSGNYNYDIAYCYEDGNCTIQEEDAGIERFGDIEIQSDCFGIGFERRTGNIVLVDQNGNSSEPTTENICTLKVRHKFLPSSRDLDILINTTSNVIDYE